MMFKCISIQALWPEGQAGFLKLLMIFLSLPIHLLTGQLYTSLDRSLPLLTIFICSFSFHF